MTKVMNSFFRLPFDTLVPRMGVSVGMDFALSSLAEIHYLNEAQMKFRSFGLGVDSLTRLQ